MGLHNVTARSLDLEQIAEPDGTYDAVLCREGLMFASDPARAAGEIARVLRPGGRAAIAVWGPRARQPVARRGVRCRRARRWACRCRRRACPDRSPWRTPAGCTGCSSTPAWSTSPSASLPVPLLSPSFEDWWTRTSSLAGPLSAVLAGLPAEAKADLESRVRAAGRALRDGGRAALPRADPPGLRTAGPLRAGRGGAAPRPAGGAPRSAEGP